MAKNKSRKQDIRKIIDSALNSGVVDQKMSIGDVVSRLGSDIDPVAGYAIAWDKYVLVVADEVIAPEITFPKR